MKAYTINSPRVLHVTSVWGIDLTSGVPWWRRLLNKLQRRPYQPQRPNG